MIFYLEEMNKVEERFYWLREIGCIVCRKYYGVYTPPEIHHIDGQSKKGAHFRTIPLCHRHHRNKCNNDRYVSRADGKKVFNRMYCTEGQLLREVDQLIAQCKRTTSIHYAAQIYDHDPRASSK